MPPRPDEPPRPRVLEPRDRIPPLRDFVLRFAAVLREGLAAPVAREAAGLAAVERLEAVPADLARVAVLRVPAALRAPVVLRVPLALRVPVERLDDVLLRPPVARADARVPLLREEPELVLASPSRVHLPDITRCAASATASAMIEPSLVALDTTLVAACDAVSAASSPASRIARRALGLALIAAAAAARPAASISLLIAAFASLSIVSFAPDEEPDDLLEDLAIALSPSVSRKDT